MIIILFDIDGTLLHIGGAGKMAMIQAFKDIYGVSYNFDGIVMAGKTDEEILKEAIHKVGFIGKNNQIEMFKKRYFQLLMRNIRRKFPGEKIYPGVKPLLDKLIKYKNVKLGIITGNWKISAFIKLKHFDLDRYFEFGAFADDAVSREDLLPFALKRCNIVKTINVKDVILIGDTPRDVNCAKTHGTISIGVATGSYTTEDLVAKGADLVIRDLNDTSSIISWIFSTLNICSKKSKPK